MCLPHNLVNLSSRLNLMHKVKIWLQMYSMLQYVCIEVYYGKNQKINCVRLRNDEYVSRFLTSWQTFCQKRRKSQFMQTVYVLKYIFSV